MSIFDNYECDGQLSFEDILYDYTFADNQVFKTISRPCECANAGCVASCCIAFYKDNKALFKDNPKNCPDFKEEGE